MPYNSVPSKYVESECCDNGKEAQISSYHLPITKAQTTIPLLSCTHTGISFRKCNTSSTWSFYNISTFYCLCFSGCLTDLCCSAVNRLFHTSVSLTRGIIAHLWRYFCQFPLLFSVSFNRTLYPFSLSCSFTLAVSLSYLFFFTGTLCALNYKISLVLKDRPEPYLHTRKTIMVTNNQ